MEVILQEDVPNVGHIGEVVKVRDGFGRNYLLPRGLALVADNRNLRVLEHQKRLTAAKRERTQKPQQITAISQNTTDQLVYYDHSNYYYNYDHSYFDYYYDYDHYYNYDHRYFDYYYNYYNYYFYH